MVPVPKGGFTLDRRLEADTRPLLLLGLCELRVMNDRRWPWLVLVPQRSDVEELFDLAPLDQVLLTFEIDLAARALKKVTDCAKLNIGALGNIVRQMHVHLIARFEGDEAWPGPVWGHGEREPYRREDLHRFSDTLRTAL